MLTAFIGLCQIACSTSCIKVTFLHEQFYDMSKASDGPSAAPLHLNLSVFDFLFLLPHPPKLRCSSSVVLSPDAGGTLVLVFIPTWLTN